MCAPRAEAPVRILTAGTLAGGPQLTSAVSTENAPVTGAVAAPPPHGASTTTSQWPTAPDQSNLYAVLDCAYPGRDCVAMRATHHSLESTPSEPSQPSNLPTCPASPSHFSGPRGLALCVILVEA